MLETISDCSTVVGEDRCSISVGDPSDDESWCDELLDDIDCAAQAGPSSQTEFDM